VVELRWYCWYRYEDVVVVVVVVRSDEGLTLRRWLGQALPPSKSMLVMSDW
jgi:hypothetical protein